MVPTRPIGSNIFKEKNQQQCQGCIIGLLVIMGKFQTFQVSTEKIEQSNF